MDKAQAIAAGVALQWLTDAAPATEEGALMRQRLVEAHAHLVAYMTHIAEGFSTSEAVEAASKLEFRMTDSQHDLARAILPPYMLPKQKPE